MTPRKNPAVADPAALDPAIAGVLKRPFAEQVAFFRGKLGNLVPTARWTDMMRGAHDRGFMVAGAQSADLLAGLGAAVDRAISEGTSIETFRKDFAALAKRNGWDYTGEFNWRTRTIYRTNMATSYAAGRTAQLREGQFPYWMYRHGDSVEPRLQHLAWDGMVLPADHPFWRTHTPPNGWGCSCRVVGLRDPSDAEGLGGDPDKKLPEDWDAIVPSTGAPVGVGKGWDYQPGDSVSDIVRQMAAKTQQWDYTLAKAYMQSVPESVRDALATAYRDLPSVANDTRLYAQRILEGRTHLEIPEYRTLGLAGGEHVAQVARLKQLDIAGYDFAIDRYGPLHVRSHHGAADVEAPRGQRAIEPADYARLPELLNGADRVKDAGVSKATQLALVSTEKVIDGELYKAVWEVRPKRKMLVLKSFWVGKAPKLK